MFYSRIFNTWNNKITVHLTHFKNFRCIKNIQIITSGKVKSNYTFIRQSEHLRENQSSLGKNNIQKSPGKIILWKTVMEQNYTGRHLKISLLQGTFEGAQIKLLYLYSTQNTLNIYCNNSCHQFIMNHWIIATKLGRSLTNTTSKRHYTQVPPTRVKVQIFPKHPVCRIYKTIVQKKHPCFSNRWAIVVVLSLQ